MLRQIWERAVVEPTIWIDDDVHVTSEIISGLHRIREDIGCALYNVRRSHEIACDPSGPARSDGLVPLRWCHFGATITRPDVWRKMFASRSPVCCGVPCLWLPIIEGRNYLGDDVAFCRRAEAVGVSMVADPSLLVAHGWPEREYPSPAQVELFRRGKRLSTGGELDPALDFRVMVDRFIPSEPRSLPAQYPGDSGGSWVPVSSDQQSPDGSPSLSTLPGAEPSPNFVTAKERAA